MTTPPALPKTPEEWIARASAELATTPDRLGDPTIYIHALAINLGVRKSPEVRTAALWASTYAHKWANPTMIPLRDAFMEIAAEHPVPK